MNFCSARVCFVSIILRGLSMTRSKKNKNYLLTHGDEFMGLPILSKYEPFYTNYLTKIYNVINTSIENYPRLIGLRFDLHLPKKIKNIENSRVMTSFIRSLQMQIKFQSLNKLKLGKRVHQCEVNYVWVRERLTADNEHYHVLILLNKDRFNWTGKIRKKGNNLISMIIEAWARSIDVDYDEALDLVHFSKNYDGQIAVHRLDSNDVNFEYKFEQLFKHASYLAKETTKTFGSHRRNIGTSRMRR